MMPRKKRRVIVISIIVLLVLLFIIGGICIYLYLTTDSFKSNRTLFEKYLAQNFNVIQNFTQNKSNNIDNYLNNNKYTSNLSVDIKYTSDSENTENNTNETNNEETTENSINNLQLNINSQIDKTNQYDYKDIRLAYQTENVARAEYIKDNTLLGIRLDGIKQFVTIDNQDIESLSNKADISIDTLNQIYLLSNHIDISELINFTEEEKETLIERYANIIDQNTEKESFKRNNKATIEVNGVQTIANGYYIETTKENFNNVLMKILEQIAQDEIILNKIDNIQSKLIEYNIIQNNEDINLRNEFINYINNYITEIKNKNIGNETHRITVYENNGQIVKTVIETQENTIEIDVYNNGTSVIIQNSKLKNKNQTKNLIKLENGSQDNIQSLIIQYEEIENDIVKNNIKFETKKEIQNNDIDGNINLIYELDGNKVEISATEFIERATEFEDKMELNEENNVTLNDLQEDQITNILNILSDNINNKINNITSKVSPDDLNLMLKELGFVQEDIFIEEEPVQVTEVERNRFNSQLTFFIGEDQEANNINLLLNSIAQSLEDATIENITNDRGEEKLNQITLNINRNSQNDEKLQQVRNIITENNGETFDVTMSYDEETQLINRIFIKVHQEQ